MFGQPVGYSPLAINGPSQRFADLTTFNVDFRHPLARGLKCFLAPSGVGFTDLVRRGRILTNTGSFGYRNVTAGGPTSRAFVQSTTIRNATTDLDFTSGGWSIAASFAYFAWIANTYYVKHINSVSDADNQGLAIGSGPTTSNHVQVYVGANTASASRLFESSGTIAAGEHSVVATGTGLTITLYIDGAQDSTNTGINQSPLALANEATAQFSCDAASTSSTTHVAAFWNRALSAAEARAFHLDPTQFLAAPYTPFIHYGPETYAPAYRAWTVA